MWKFDVDLLSWVAIGWLLVIVACDFRLRVVKNNLILIGLLIGLSWSSQIGMMPIIYGVGGAVLALLPFYLIRTMGAGDVKFGAVLGLWFGFSPSLLYVWLGGSLLAGLHGLAVIGWRVVRGHPQFQALMAFSGISLKADWNKELKVVKNTEPANRRQRIQRTIPYAGYLALAALYLIWKKGAPIG